MQESTQNLIDESRLSPMMLQWLECKKTAKDAILLFRLGDFYEAFHDDAILLADELELTLTKRQNVPMSGIPQHTCESYLDKLISKGYRVAIAEQVEDAKFAKGLVQRKVVRTVTPGTIVNSGLLSEKSHNFFASAVKVGSLFGLSFLDLTTGEFRVIEFDNEKDFLNEIYKIQPVEFLVSKKFHEKNGFLIQDIKQNSHMLINVEEDWRFEHQETCEFLTSHFKINHLEGFGLKGMIPGIIAAGALLAYVQNTLSMSIEHIHKITPYSNADYMSIDRATQRHLELTFSIHEHSKKHTLISVLDFTFTPMGGRLLDSWIKRPLMDVIEIKKRQAGVDSFFRNSELLNHFCQLLRQVKDLERLSMRISSGHASPKDLLALRLSLEPLPFLKKALTHNLSQIVRDQCEKIHDFTEVTSIIAQAVVDEPPFRIGDGRIFRDGFNHELDELREITRDSKSWMASYQNTLREETGIKTLKVGYNRLSGYFIEVSKGQSDKVPDSFHRRQTLVNSERFITPELKEYESKVLSADERISALETELFHMLRMETAKHTRNILDTAKALGVLDCLQSLAQAALKYHYVMPDVDTGNQICIEEGRHPVVEAFSGDRFIPNDILLDQEENRLIIITGPNMAGKSTYIRQAGLLVIMAQMGSFIPAKRGKLGVIDKVFTRIGASDDLARGQSTFMVEMTETANILNNATSKSLVILDEIGRGTSTYDGISIAWAVAEHLLLEEGKNAKTLFATHYWELTKLEGKIPGAINYHVAVQETHDTILFLRKIIRGSADRSYGIHVGRLAGLPLSVIKRAKEILIHLEENANRKSAFEPSAVLKKGPNKAKIISNEIQLTFFEKG